MKSLDGLNFYEILQVPFGASITEIEQAYADARSIYSEDALATYCLFYKDDREKILQSIDTAYLTLTDKDKRAAYDKELAASGRFNESMIRKDQEKVPVAFLPDNANESMHVSRPSADLHRIEDDTYTREIMLLFDSCGKNIDLLKRDPQGIKNRLKFLRMKEEVHKRGISSSTEPELLAMLAHIEKSSLRWQRTVSLIIILYTFLAIASFLLLTATNAILLPAFNIPYSVLLMGLIGCVVSMWLRMPNIRSEQSLRYDSTVWFIICPPVATIAAGIFFGIAQILLPLFQVELSDESWLFWIPAFVIGFVNWVYVYDKLRGGFANRRHRESQLGRNAITEKP